MAKLTPEQFSKMFFGADTPDQSANAGDVLKFSGGKDMSQPAQYGLMSMAGPGSAAGVPQGYQDMSQMGQLQRAPQRNVGGGGPGASMPGQGPVAPSLAGLMSMVGEPQQQEQPEFQGPSMNPYLMKLLGG